MPLITGKSPKSFSRNVKTEVAAGKPQDQAVAIAYSKKREAMHHKMAHGGAVENCSYCMGGYAEGGMADNDSDNEAIMDQCAMECMQAIEAKDKEGFIEALQVLVADLLMKMHQEPEMEGE